MSLFGSVGKTLSSLLKGKRDKVTKKPITGQTPLKWEPKSKKNKPMQYRTPSIRRTNRLEWRARRAMARLNPIRGV